MMAGASPEWAADISGGTTAILKSIWGYVGPIERALRPFIMYFNTPVAATLVAFKLMNLEDTQASPDSKPREDGARGSLLFYWLVSTCLVSSIVSSIAAFFDLTLLCFVSFFVFSLSLLSLAPLLYFFFIPGFTMPGSGMGDVISWWILVPALVLSIPLGLKAMSKVQKSKPAVHITPFGLVMRRLLQCPSNRALYLIHLATYTIAAPDIRTWLCCEAPSILVHLTVVKLSYYCLLDQRLHILLGCVAPVYLIAGCASLSSLRRQAQAIAEQDIEVMQIPITDMQDEKLQAERVCTT